MLVMVLQIFFFFTILKSNCCKIARIKPLHLKKNNLKTLRLLSTLFWYDNGIICYDREHIDVV